MKTLWSCGQQRGNKGHLRLYVWSERERRGDRLLPNPIRPVLLFPVSLVRRALAERVERRRRKEGFWRDNDSDWRKTGELERGSVSAPKTFTPSSPENPLQRLQEEQLASSSVSTKAGITLAFTQTKWEREGAKSKSGTYQSPLR